MLCLAACAPARLRTRRLARIPSLRAKRRALRRTGARSRVESLRDSDGGPPLPTSARAARISAATKSKKCAEFGRTLGLLGDPHGQCQADATRSLRPHGPSRSATLAAIYVPAEEAAADRWRCRVTQTSTQPFVVPETHDYGTGAREADRRGSPSKSGRRFRRFSGHPGQSFLLNLPAATGRP